MIIFLPHPSSPARRGSTSPSAPSPQERAPTGKPAVLYSQTSFNCVDSRLHSAEHSNEFDALLSLAREFAHKGLLVVIDAIELRIFLPHPSSPARRGSTSPSAPSPQERAPTGKPAVLYSQTSSRPFGVARDCLRNRIAIV